MNRTVYEVLFADGQRERYSVTIIEVKDGYLSLYDYGLLAAFAPGQWLEVNLIDPLCPPSPPPSTSATNEPPRDGVGG